MRHSLFVYDDDDVMVARMAPLLSSGLDRDEPAVVVIDRRKWQLLAGALGSDADAISYIDRDAFYTRPEAALAGYDSRIRRFLHHGASAIRVFGELPRCDADHEWNTWISYEAIVNRAFAHHPVSITCGYDSREVPEFVLESAWETHREVLNDDGQQNPRYHEPEDVVRAQTPVPWPLSGLRVLPLDAGPRELRERLLAEMSVAGVAAPEADNMLRATGEVLANARRHGGDSATMRVGRIGDQFVCEVSDLGPGMDNPLAGFLPPRPGHADGAGLWVARQLTTQLELLPSSGGLTVRLWI